jgi:DNA-binding MarR family transcriptional regulator
MHGTTGESPTAKGLEYWALAGDPDQYFPLVMELMQHPGFADIARRSAEGSLGRTERRVLAGSSSHDIYRFYLVTVVLYLDMTGGLTRTRLIEFCTDIKLASPGRAAGFLDQLRRSGYLELAKDQVDRRSRRYCPTPSMVEEYRELQIEGLRLLAEIEPEVSDVIARFHDQEVFRAFILRLGEGIRAYLKDRSDTDITLFTDRNAGFAMLFLLIASADPSDPFPPKGPLQASLTGLSKRLHVSRGHIFRLLRDAEQRGLLRRDVAKGLVWLDERVRFLVAAYIATVFVGFLICCHAALNAPRDR